MQEQALVPQGCVRLSTQRRATTCAADWRAVIALTANLAAAIVETQLLKESCDSLATRM